MNSLLINEDRTIWVGLIISIMIHSLIFAFSGKTFIQHAQYNVQPSVQTVEVSIEEIKYTGDDSQKGSEPIKTLEKINKIKDVGHSKSGVMVKANPNYFQNPPPEYPEFAKQMHQEGLVILAVDVGSDGTPIKVEIEQSSNYRMLDQAALKAVSLWKFQPGRIGSVPVESKVTVPVRFSLEK